MNEYGNQACSEWNDQRMTDDLLSTAKHIAGEYGSLICEGSNEQLRQVLNNNMQQTIQDQYQIFDHMRQRGWYETKNAQPQDIQSAKQKFTQEKSGLL